MYEVNINYLQLLESLKKLLQLKSRARFAWYYWALATRGDLNFRTIWCFGWRVAMSFCNWRRNKAPFKVRELPRRLLTARCNVESRLKDAPREGERLRRFSRNFEIRAMHDPREEPPTARRRGVHPYKELLCSSPVTEGILRWSVREPHALSRIS